MSEKYMIALNVEGTKTDAVRALAPSDINVIYSNVPPVYGCAVEAMYDMGIGCDSHFKEEFMRGYAK